MQGTIKRLRKNSNLYKI